MASQNRRKPHLAKPMTQQPCDHRRCIAGTSLAKGCLFVPALSVSNTRLLQTAFACRLKLGTVGGWDGTKTGDSLANLTSQLQRIDVQGMRAREAYSKPPCVHFAPVYAILPSTLPKAHRGRLRKCQPHRSRLTAPASMKNETVASNSPAHGHIVRDARDAPPYGPRVRITSTIIHSAELCPPHCMPTCNL